MVDIFGVCVMLCCIFFFSSRRRHTRFDCDWSSDVCSSDLLLRGGIEHRQHGAGLERHPGQTLLDHPELDDVRGASDGARRSEEHTSELQSQSNLVCRLLLEKKKNMHD